MKIDPTTLQAGQETDVMVARDWMEWVEQKDALFSALGEFRRITNFGPRGVVIPRGNNLWQVAWGPSTNPAHAGEARRKVSTWHLTGVGDSLVACTIVVDGQPFRGHCECSEVTGNTPEEIKGRAEALAICRAIDKAMKAKGGK